MSQRSYLFVLGCLSDSEESKKFAADNKLSSVTFTIPDGEIDRLKEFNPIPQIRMMIANAVREKFSAEIFDSIIQRYERSLRVPTATIEDKPA